MVLTFTNIALALGAYLVVVLGIAYIAMKRLEVTPDDYYLAGRGLGTLVLTGTVLATWFSTFAFLGGPGTFFSSGSGWLWFGFFNITGPILIWVIGTRFWLLGRKFGHVTPSDLVAQFYEEDDSVRILVAVIAILALVPYSVIQLTGAAQALVGALGAQQYFTSGVLLLMGMVALYLFVGGLRAVAWIDTLQATIFMPALILTAGAAVYWAGGFSAGWSAALAENPELWTFSAEGAGSWWTGALVWTMAWVFIPHMWQRMLMAKNPKVIARTAAVSGTISLWVITFSALVIGGIGSGLILELPEGTAADGFMTILYAEYLPAGAIFITVAAFAAGMSTISSQILTTSSIFVRDIAKKPFNPDMDNRKEARIGRYFTIFFSIAVLAIALSPAAERAIIPLASDGVALALLYIPCVLGMLFWEDASTAGAKWSLLIGFVFLQIGIWTPVGSVFPVFGPPVYGLALTAVVYYVVSKTTASVPEDRQAAYREILIKGMRIEDPPTGAEPRPSDD
jgi:SSS family solute:Na+ symporter